MLEARRLVSASPSLKLANVTLLIEMDLLNSTSFISFIYMWDYDDVPYSCTCGALAHFTDFVTQNISEYISSA